MLTCAVLVANNLRDIPTDAVAGKRTLAVLLGDTDTRRLYAALVLVPLLFSRAGRAAQLADAARRCSRCRSRCCRPAAVLGGADGRQLIPVLGRTGPAAAGLVSAHRGRARAGAASSAGRRSDAVAGLVAARLAARPAARPRAAGRAAPPAPRRGAPARCASAASSRARSPRNSTIDSGSATISADQQRDQQRHAGQQQHAGDHARPGRAGPARRAPIVAARPGRRAGRWTRSCAEPTTGRRAARRRAHLSDSSFKSPLPPDNRSSTWGPRCHDGREIALVSREVRTMTVTTQAGGDERLLTPGEVASLFRVDPKTVTRWASAGRIGSIRTPGGHRRFRESEVRSMLADLTSEATVATRRGPDATSSTTSPRASRPASANLDGGGGCRCCSSSRSSAPRSSHWCCGRR